MPERSPHPLAVEPSDEPHWVRLVVHPIAEVYPASLVGVHEPPPAPGQWTGLCLVGKTPDDLTGAALPKLMWVAEDDVVRRTLG